MKNSQFLIAILISAAIGLAVSGSHPTQVSSAYTTAPGDSFCSQCHTPSATLNGTVEIQGLPSEIVPGETYPLTVVLTNTVGSAVKGGFQMLVLNNNNQNTGTFSNINTSTTAIKTVSGGRTYFGHQPAINFPGGGVLTWDVDWTAPTANPTSQAKFYVAGVIANGSNSDNGDRPVAFNIFVPYQSTTPDPINLTISNVINPSCSNTNDGSATVNIVGGSPPYNIIWNNGETTPTALALPPGTASVTVTDIATGNSSKSTTLVAPSPITLNVNTFDASCFNTADGSATAMASGGTGTITYSWSNGGQGSSQNNLVTGSYTVTATDANGCETSEQFFIDAPDPVLINVVSIQNPSCSGGQNGAIEVEAEGGSGGFIYQWSNGNNLPLNTNLSAGSYTVSATDNNGCRGTASYNLTQPAPVSVSFPSVNHVTCFGLQNGVVTAAASGGNGNFTYVWSNGANGPTVQNLGPGVYTVTVIDVEDCTQSASVTITEPLPITIQLIELNAASCSGAEDGGIIIEPMGTFTNFQIVWSNGVTTPANLNLASGNYTVTVTDQNQCSKTAAYTVGTNAPFQLSLVSSSAASCFGVADGQAEVTVNPPGNYQYEWSNGAMGSTLTNLPAGTYVVTASDDSGCESSPLTVEISQPSQILTQGNIIQELSCYGDENGIIGVSPLGGSGNLSVQWSTGSQDTIINNLGAGMYSVTITDEDLCFTVESFELTQPDSLVLGLVSIDSIACFGQNTGALLITANGGTLPYDVLWSNGDSTLYIEDLVAGDYTVTLTDDGNCTVIQTFTMTQPSQIQVAANITNVTPGGGNDGAISLMVSGGSGVKTALWSNGESGFVIDSLALGNYRVTITDENNCTLVRQYVVSLADCQLDVTITTEDATCFNGEDGSISLSVLNPIGPYQVNVYLDTTKVQSPLDQLMAGTYTLEVVDSVFCTVLIENIVISEGPEIIVNGTITHPTTGQSNGSIDVVGTGGTGSLTFEWFNATSQKIGEGERISGLKQGFYFLITTDSLGCQKMQNFILQDVVSTKDEFLIPAMKIFPNPSQGDFTIQFEKPVYVRKFVLRNSIGQTFETIEVNGLIQSKQLQVNTYNSGMGMLETHTDFGVVSQKLMLK